MNILETAIKALGVKISPEDIGKIEALVPQIPGRVEEGIRFINSWQSNFDARLKAIEEMQARILAEVKNGRRNGTGDAIGTGDDLRAPGND